jgi:hypothetical protein
MFGPFLLQKLNGSVCSTCGGFEYVNCTACKGSKSSRKTRISREISVLKCIICNENGLQRCPTCNPGQDLQKPEWLWTIKFLSLTKLGLYIYKYILTCITGEWLCISTLQIIFLAIFRCIHILHRENDWGFLQDILWLYYFCIYVIHVSFWFIIPQKWL